MQEELEETLRLSDAKDDELEKLREEVGIVVGGASPSVNFLISLFVVVCFYFDIRQRCSRIYLSRPS